MLAADYGFRSAVNSGDEETIRSVLENHGHRIGAEVTALLDTQLNLRSRWRRQRTDDFQGAVRQMAPLLAEPAAGAAAWAVVGACTYQFVWCPVAGAGGDPAGC